MGRLAIVIPSVTGVEALENTLVSVLENRPPRCEIYVVHSHVYDDPYQLTGEVQFIKAPARASYASCANLGVTKSTGDVVHLLATGCRVTEGWTDHVLRHFNDPRVAVVAPLVVDEHNPGYALASAINYGVGGVRHCASRPVAEVREAGVSPILAASLAAVFYNRLTLATAGYLSTQVGADLADVDLGLLLHHAGYVSIVDPRSCVISPSRPLERARPFRSALRAERLFWRNAPALGWLKSLAAHAVAVATDVASHAPRPSMFTTLAGRIVGTAMFRGYRRHHQRLIDLQNSAPVAVEKTAPSHIRIDRAHTGKTTRSGTGDPRTRAA